MTGSGAEEIISRKKDRCIAIILGVKERDCDQYLPPLLQARLRKVVLDQLNEFSDIVLDVVRGLDDGQSVFNDEYFSRFEQKLDEIYRAVM